MKPPTIDGQALRRAREAKSWTQGQLAYHAEVDQSVISRLERGSQRGVRFVTIQQVARALGLSVSDFVHRPPPGQVSLQAEQDALDIATLPVDDQEVVRSLIRSLQRRQGVTSGSGAPNGETPPPGSFNTYRDKGQLVTLLSPELSPGVGHLAYAH